MNAHGEGRGGCSGAPARLRQALMVEAYRFRQVRGIVVKSERLCYTVLPVVHQSNVVVVLQRQRSLRYVHVIYGATHVGT